MCVRDRAKVTERDRVRETERGRKRESETRTHKLLNKVEDTEKERDKE